MVLLWRKVIICTVNQYCTNLTNNLMRQPKVSPLDFCLLKSFVEFGGDVATGVEAITRLRTLLEQKQ